MHEKTMKTFRIWVLKQLRYSSISPPCDFYISNLLIPHWKVNYCVKEVQSTVQKWIRNQSILKPLIPRDVVESKWLYTPYTLWVTPYILRSYNVYSLVYNPLPIAYTFWFFYDYITAYSFPKSWDQYQLQSWDQYQQISIN